VHFQWTGSDYNPKRNPNDGEGAGDLTEENRDQASRADRSNLVEQDLVAVTPVGRQNNPKLEQKAFAATGNGHHIGESPAGRAYPMGGKLSEYNGMFWKADGSVDKDTIMKLALLNQQESLATKGKKCKSIQDLNNINNQNNAERDPFNCAKLNAAQDKYGQRTPYFDGGLVKMNKGGKFSYMSTRNNNFSNRNMVGFMCVKNGETGQCPANFGTCRKTFEDDLLANYAAEGPDGQAARKLRLL